MAVDAVALEMGPRARRRFGRATIAVGVIGALVAAALLTRSPGTGPSARSAQLGSQASNARLVFGMTPQQVRRRTGKPTATQGSCWLFQPTTAGMVGSISVQPSFSRSAYDPRTTRDLKVCFLGGAYSDSYLREFDQRQDTWVWAPWPLTLVGAPSP